MKKGKQFSIRISEQDLETIRRKAAQAHMSQSDYVTACCLGKRIVILDGLREVLRQQKAIGNNLNQLTVLANMGKVQFANLDSVRKNQYRSAGNAGRGCRKIAIVHFVNYKKGTQTRSCMKSVMRYVAQTSKTLWNGQQLVSGIGCQPETAFDEFLSTKLLHHKDDGVMFYHMVQSFPKGADIDLRTVHEAARRLAGYFEGCEVLVCTHIDREHIHSHCIINSVNFETGRKVHMADEQIQELRIRNDQICEELGLPKFQRDGQRQSRGMSNAEYYTADRGESWKFELMRVIDECMRCAGNREEFLILLRSEGYDATWTDSRKNITYTTPEGRKCRDSKLHMEKYLKENMEAEFGYRTENDNTRNVDAAQKADGRGATAGTQRDGHGAELERAARNAGQAVPAADAVGHGPENASDETGSTGIPDRDADERSRVRETGWEPEREVFFQLQGADRDYEERPDRDSEQYEETAFRYGTGSAEENPTLRVDLGCGSDLLRGAVRLGRAVEQLTDDAPQRDGTTTSLHIDSKRRRKLQQKKTALGHQEDDHEDCRMEQQL